MTYYWVSLIALAIYSLNKYTAIQNFFYSCFLLFLIILIGLRFEIGGDWEAYLDWQKNTEGYSIYESLVLPSPVYSFINILSENLGGIYFVNLCCAATCVLGLHMFSLTSDHPKFLFVSLIPFIIFIFSMGFVRQSLALSFVLMVYNRNSFIFIVGAFFAIFSHVSAILILPIYYLFRRDISYARVLLFLFLVAIFVVMFYEQFFLYFKYYVAMQEYRSAGVFYRLSPLLIILTFFVLRHLYIGSSNSTRSAEAIIFTFLPMLFLFLVAIGGFSTSADRMFYYVLPLVALYISNSNTLFKLNVIIKARSVFLVSNYALFFLWMLLSDHVRYWVPYKNGIFH